MRRLIVLATAASLWTVLIAVPVITAQIRDDPATEETGYFLEEILDRTQTRLQWDPYREHGAILRGDQMISFVAGREIAVVNYSVLYRITAPRRVEGSIVFERDFLELALDVFPPRVSERRIGAIFIDPGHGGKDPGAVGRHEIEGTVRELREKDVVLDVSRRLATLLERRFPDKKIVLSRGDDEYLTLEERTDLANAIPVEPSESVLFVSVHANASLNTRARGFEVWVLPPEFRRRNLISAERVGVEDPDVLSILNTIREEEITLESVLLARNILAGMESRVGMHSPNRGIREESWYVVRNARMPSVLIEIGFLTNREEFLQLRKSDYLQSITEGIYTGINIFIDSYEEVGRGQEMVE
jgi:N-acetylmuramoyl-L-alanine amidase